MKRVDGIWYVKIGSIWHNTHSKHICDAFFFLKNFMVRMDIAKYHGKPIGGTI